VYKSFAILGHAAMLSHAIRDEPHVNLRVLDAVAEHLHVGVALVTLGMSSPLEVGAQ